MIDTIRGIVETEQAESDRATEAAAQTRQQRLELLITVISTGLAVSGISSQVTSEPLKTILTRSANDKPSDSPEATLSVYLSYYNFLDVLFHIVVGVLVALPVGLLVWWMQKRSRNVFR